MESWKEYKLSDLCEVGRGSSPRPIIDQRYFKDGEIPWIKIADATASGKYIYETKEHVNEFGASFSRYLDEGSLIIAASGVSLGQIKFLGVKGCIHDGWLYTSNFKKELIVKEFLYYFLIYYSEAFHNFSSGAAIQNINTDILRKTVIKLPSVDEQQQIVTCLSAYDDLIEVNNQRIKLLEETARELYKEWFVRMRFPGHKEAKFVKGVPEGWELKNLDQAAEVTSSKRIYLSDYVSEGVPFYRGKEISLKSKNESLSDILYISQKKFENIKKTFGVPNVGDILITAVGTIGNIYRVNESDDDFYFKDGNLIWIKTSDDNSLSMYLYFYFISDSFTNSLSSVTIGSSQEALTIASVKKINVIIPSEKLIVEFYKHTNPIKSQIETLQQQNTQLRQIRDRLLPRLISGKLEVK